MSCASFLALANASKIRTPDTSRPDRVQSDRAAPWVRLYYPSAMSTWLVTLTTSGVSGSIGVIGVLIGSWLTARRDDRRQVREMQHERDSWSREDERRWAEQRRSLYAQYLDAVHPWMFHVRHWAGPYWEPEATTKETLQKEEGDFEWMPISGGMSALESELTLIGSEDVRKAAQSLHAQLLAFEATLIGLELDVIGRVAKNCEGPYDRLTWAFRADLGVESNEPPVKALDRPEAPTKKLKHVMGLVPGGRLS